MTDLRQVCCVLAMVMTSLEVSPSAFSADESAAFRFSRPIVLSAAAEDELFSVAIDSHIYAATRDGFPDLRILDAQDRQIPFLIRHVTEEQSKSIFRFRPVSELDLRPLNANGLEIRFTLEPQVTAPTGLKFLTPLQNFEQQVQIYATVNGLESLLVEGALIFDYTQFMDVRRTEVDLPETTAREFRVIVDAMTSDQESEVLELSRMLKGNSEDSRTLKTTIQRRPFRIDQIEVRVGVAEENQREAIVQPWPTADFSATQDAENRQTVVELTCQREPLTQLTLSTSSRNFSRRASVQTRPESAAAVSWNTIASATISQYQLREILDRRLTISLPETRTERLRVVVENLDSPELNIDSVEVSGHCHEVIFLANPTQSLRLLYGSEQAQPLTHDTAALTNALAKHIRPIPSDLGSLTEIAVVNAPLNTNSLLNNPLVLSAIIGVLIILLGAGLFQASRRMEQLPPDDRE